MSGFETSLLLDFLERTEPTDSMLQQFREGSFTELLGSPDVTETLLLDQQDLWQSWDLDLIAAEISLNLSTQRKCESALLAVACSLNIFTQANWTGPPVEQTSPLCSNEEQRKRCLESLSVCGCEPYHLLRRPELLFISRVLLEGCQQHLSRFPSLVLWRLRYCYLYQSVLDEPCTHLFELLHSCLTLTQQTTQLLQSSAQLSVEYYLTAAGVYYCYHHTTNMSQMVQRSRDIIKLNVELVGAMGKRTYWQDSRPQLALKVNADWCNQGLPTSTIAAPTSAVNNDAPISTTAAAISPAATLTSTTDTATSNVAAPTSTTAAPTSAATEPTSTIVAPISTADTPVSAASQLWTAFDCTIDVSPPLLEVNDLTFEEFECQNLPVDVILQDDTRRPRIEYTDLEHTPMSSLQQAVVLNMFFLEQRSQGRDTIRDEQLMVMLNALTQQPRVWSLQLAVLLQRCGLESDARRTVERAMVQTQGLLEAVDAAQPPLRCRLQLFYCCRPPTRWELQRELAARFLGLGLVKSALDIYERLELWDDAIRCYHHLQQRQRAEQVVRRLIGDSGESPRLLCLLGDATDDVTCYQRAWDMSGQKYWRAIRSQGLYYYHRKQYDVCIPLLRHAADLNGLQYDVWTRLAYAALQEKDWTLCATAYRRCCVLEPDNYEAWNNIARAYVQLGQKERAWKTLQEALRFSFDNCKIWENFLLVSVDIGEFEEALNAYNRLSEIGEKHVDTEVLCILTDAVLQDIRDRHGNPASRLRSKLTALINRISKTVTSCSVVWRLHGDLAAAVAGDCPAGDRLVPVTSYQRALRCSVLQSHWHQQTESCRQALTICHKLLCATLDLEKVSRDLENDNKLVALLSSVKMSVHSSVTKMRSVQSMGPDGDPVELRDDLSLCDRLLKQIIDAIERRQT